MSIKKIGDLFYEGREKKLLVCGYQSEAEEFYVLVINSRESLSSILLRTVSENESDDYREHLDTLLEKYRFKIGELVSLKGNKSGEFSIVGYLQMKDDNPLIVIKDANRTTDNHFKHVSPEFVIRK